MSHPRSSEIRGPQADPSSISLRKELLTWKQVSGAPARCSTPRLCSETGCHEDCTCLLYFAMRSSHHHHFSDLLEK
jgi:hypothetical protein